MKTELLNKVQIDQITERIAFEIYENFHNESKILIGGIKGNGFIFAERLSEKLKSICNDDFNLGIDLFKISINKQSPLNSEITTSPSIDSNDKTPIILVDDVINSGKTMLYAVSHLLQDPKSTIKTAVLVNRTHRRFPISADFVGMNISTTIQDNIRVEFGENEKAYLL